MASTTDMKGFYKQKKKNAGISKPSSTNKSKPNPKSINTATFGSNVSQPPALIAHGSPDLHESHDANEEVLRQFDLNMAYGPCAGMKRLDRWQRAASLGLNPPEDIHRLLTSGGAAVCADSLWDGRV